MPVSAVNASRVGCFFVFSSTSMYSGQFAKLSVFRTSPEDASSPPPPPPPQAASRLGSDRTVSPAAPRRTSWLRVIRGFMGPPLLRRVVPVDDEGRVRAPGQCHGRSRCRQCAARVDVLGEDVDDAELRLDDDLGSDAD